MKIPHPDKKWIRRAFIYGIGSLAVLLFTSSYLAWPLPQPPVASALDAADRAAVIAAFPADFAFGLANAPAQVEDQLDDSWMEFAGQGKVAAFRNQAAPEYKLGFWSDPAPELDLAAATGARVFRMGIDWGRLAPHKPGSRLANGRTAAEGIQDQDAMDHYRLIMQAARARGMRVMLTLFHHSLPSWSVAEGGWTNPATARHFVAFASAAAREFGDLVDEWVTFNEPNVYLLMTYVTGGWPPGREADYTSFIDTPTRRGDYNIAFDAMVKAHAEAYRVIHRYDQAKADPGSLAPSRVGIAHFVSLYYAYSLLDIPLVFASRNIKGTFDFPDAIRAQLDFLGINYYGEEVMKGTSVAFLPGREYSDSGRSIYPEGLYKVLDHVNWRYNTNPLAPDRVLPFIITENGIADEDDIFRPSYLIEHLLAVRHAMDKGVPVEGYIFWTVSDNFEWADGYGPKFGLVAVDREHGMRRIPRPSYYLFSEIVQKRQITQLMRDQAWQDRMTLAGQPRKFYRASDGKTALDQPRLAEISRTDWRMPLDPRVEEWSAVSYLDKVMTKLFVWQ